MLKRTATWSNHEQATRCIDWFDVWVGADRHGATGGGGSGGAPVGGNFTVNQYSALTVEGDGIAVRYVLDEAEIPTYQELAKIVPTIAAT